MSYSTRRLRSRWPGLALWRRLFSLWMIAIGVIALPRTGYAQAFNLLYDFGQMATDGANPVGGLIQASDGNLYGTTQQGGTNGVGTIFRITTSGALTTLYSFMAGTDGGGPSALIQASDGNLYGTTYLNGGPSHSGTVFRITTGGAFRTFHWFSGPDGANSTASLIQAKDGNLYGTTNGGGANGVGTIFRITTSGTLTTLYSFTAGTGRYGPSALIQASDGNLYGTTEYGGTYDNGTVFRITTGGQFTTLYQFSATTPLNYTNSDGANPVAGLIQAKDGNLYGTTAGGGLYPSVDGGSGTVFRITTGGKLTTLWNFNGFPNPNPTDGAVPAAALIQGKDGNLYGTTEYGGAYPGPDLYGAGTAFRITTGGKLTTLWNFNGGADGAYPLGSLIQGKDGNLYGTAYDGGEYSNSSGLGDGAVFAFNLRLPILAGISPNSANAGGPAITLTLNGTGFTGNNTVQWTNGSTTTTLATTFVSSRQLKAVVPASLIAAAGAATVTVAYAAAGVSNSQPFTIPLTTLKLSLTKVTKTSMGSYTAKISFQNVGYLTAPNVTIAEATLGTAIASTTLPLSLGSIAAGENGATLLGFPSSAGSPGTTVLLSVTGTFTGGTFTGSVNVRLP